MRITWKTYVKVALNIVIALAGLLLAVFLLPKVIGFFMPFLIGWIIASIGAPIARFLETKMKITRQIGSAVIIILVIALVFLVCYGVIYWLGVQIFGFVQELPALWEAFSGRTKTVEFLGDRFNRFIPDDLSVSISKFSQNLTDYVAEVIARIGSNTQTMEAMGNMAGKVPNFIIGVFMCVLSAYFFIAEKEGMAEFCREHLPEVVVIRGARLWRSVAGVVGGYFKAQIKIEVWIYLLLVIGLMILKVPFGAVIALGIAFIDFLPVFGSGFIMWPWAVMALLDGNIRLALGLMILWGIGQIVRQLIQPKIVGDSMGLSPLPTLVLIYIGYRIGGFGGMIFAVPVGILIRNMYREGLFHNTINSFRILFRGVNNVRRFTPEELGEKENDESQREE